MLRTALAIVGMCLLAVQGAFAEVATRPQVDMYPDAFIAWEPTQVYSTPSEACDALVQFLDAKVWDPWSAPGLRCPGTQVVGGCPTWSDFVPTNPLSYVHVPKGATRGLLVDVQANRPVSRTSCEPVSGPYHFVLLTVCGADSQGNPLNYVGNGECRCANGGALSNNVCVQQCPADMIAQDGSCVEDPLKAAGKKCPKCYAGTNPIDIGTGSKLHDENVYSASTPGGLSLSLTYNSRRPDHPASFRTEPFGALWTSNFNRQVFYVSGVDVVAMRRGDGQEIEFRPGGGGTYVADADIKDKLAAVVDGSGNRIGWQYTVDADNSVEEYEATKGLLTRVTFLSGLQQVLTYSTSSTPLSVAPGAGYLIGVADSFGRSISFVYDGGGRVVGMTDPDGASYRFQYDTQARRNLAAIVFPDTKRRSFAYGEAPYTSGVPLPNSLTGVTDENGVRYATFSYDAQGRAISSEHAGGVDRVSIVHNADGSRTVTDPTSTTRTFQFQRAVGVPKNSGITGAAAPQYGPLAQTYDTNGNLSSRTDWNGNRANYQYDLARNLETQRVEGLNSSGGITPQTRTISTQWHPTWRLATAIAEPLRITTNTYDADGTQCGAKGALCSRSIQATSDANGSQGFGATPVGSPRTWTYTYNANGSVLTIDGPRIDVSDVTTYTYYANDDPDVTKRGNLATITNAAGHVTQSTSYNAHGQPLTVVDPNGLTTTLAYDARHRLISRTVGGETTSYDYDGVGQLTKVTLPDGSYVSYGYDDAHRLTSMQDNLGNRIAYTLDAMGNRTQEQVFDPASNLAQTRSRIYSSLNRLFQELGAQNQTTEYAYDNQGNVVSVKDPLNHVTVNQYDALNRLKQVTDPNLGVTQYAYNGLDALTQVTDPRNLVTGYTVDGLGNLTLQSSPDTGITANTYDAAGNLLTQTDAKGQVTSYAYDALNRVTLITFHDGSKQLYAYDQGANGIGRLGSITETDPSNAQTSLTQYAYDQHGRVTSETRTVAGMAYVTGYSYDNAGRLSGITYPSGRTAAYSFDSLGRLAAISTTANGQTQQVVSNVAYQPFGGVKGYTLGNGQVYTRSYDQDGRIASYTLGAKTFGIGYDAGSRIEFISELGNPANSNTYGYDALDRLTSAVTASTPYSYGYDAVGNRLSKAVGAGTETLTYSPSSNRIATLTPTSGPTRNFVFDPNGSTTADGNNTYAYDTRGRMVSATSSIGATSYQVNALGQRIRKTNSLGDTVFHYDTRGHLIAETDPGGGLKREILYLGDIPVYVLQ